MSGPTDEEEFVAIRRNSSQGLFAPNHRADKALDFFVFFAGNPLKCVLPRSLG